MCAGGGGITVVCDNLWGKESQLVKNRTINFNVKIRFLRRVIFYFPLYHINIDYKQIIALSVFHLFIFLKWLSQGKQKKYI